MPAKIVTVELGRPLPTAVEGAQKYDHVWAIAMRSDVPIGCAIIDNARTPVFEEQLRAEIVRQLGPSLLQQVGHHDTEQFGLLPGQPLSGVGDGIGVTEAAEFAQAAPGVVARGTPSFFMSIIVCTVDRPVSLARCLTALTDMESGSHRLELIVVDNNPTSGQTEPVVSRFPGVRYVAELRRGSSSARNAGLAYARGEIVGYIDDDEAASPNWAVRILAPLADARIACVTGLVLPLELETESQEYFERYGGFIRGYKARLFDWDFFRSYRRRSVPTWDLGGSGNIAVRKATLEAIGGFDETLGAGVPSGVGEDTYLFYRILKQGDVCYYEPAAYVWHDHRRELGALGRQLQNYSRGQVCYQLRTLVTDGDRRALWHILVRMPAWYLKRAYQISRSKSQFPFSVLVAEVTGYLSGPYAFYRSNHLRPRSVRPPTSRVS